jgi:flagellar biosynthesis anti-sigma factor FlgM
MRIDVNHGAQSFPESNRASTQNSAGAGLDSSASVGNVLSQNQPSQSPLGLDQAQLSGVTARVRELAALAAQLPEVREERVHALRQAIQSGSYSPSLDNVAGALAAHMTIERAA